MRKEKWNYLSFFLLGLSLGVIVVSTIYEFSQKEVEVVGYTEEDILNKANELLIEKLRETTDSEETKSLKDKTQDKQIIKNEDNKDQQEIEKDSKDEDIAKNEDEEKINYIKFIIKKGESSDTIVENLYQKGLISDKEEFKKTIVNKKLVRKLMYGKFNIPENADINTVIEEITH
ncbi:hypothetical protein PV797_12165 [Clostridiaceae bacterium M8S5]|nr:hypothetical protein PV797_12165 [Clostridiaceae bacterium M8S5]